MSDTLQLAIAEVEDYLRRYPSGRFSELAQLRLDQLLAQRGEQKVEVVSSAANPYTKGTVKADLSYRVGDRYEYRVSDLLTNIPRGIKAHAVTAVTADEVKYNQGFVVTDLLGNYIRTGDGKRFGPSQFYVTEYSVGKKWSTRYAVTFRNGDIDDIEIDFKVVDREKVIVPAGTFDAFRVEGRGWVLGKAIAIEETYWIAPDKVARVLKIETWRRPTKGRFKINKADREELLSFNQVNANKLPP